MREKLIKLLMKEKKNLIKATVEADRLLSLLNEIKQYPSLKAFTDAVGLSYPTVLRQIAPLRKLGLLKINKNYKTINKGE